MMQRACPRCGGWASGSSNDGYMGSDEFRMKFALIFILGLIVAGVAALVMYKTKH